MNIHYCAQGSLEWHALRRHRATGSCFDRLLTPTGKASSDRTRLAYALELLGQASVPDWEEWAGTKFMARGKELEPKAREAFVRHTGHRVVEVGFVSIDGAGVSPDGLLICDRRWFGGLEAKCPGPKVHLGYLYDGGLPDDYKQQVHGSLAVTGLPEWHFWSWMPGLRPHHVIVRPDDYTRLMAVAIREFTQLYAEVRRKLEPGLKLDY